jgi:hypothetical protein
MLFQKLRGISIKSVDAFKRSVKKTMLSPKEAVTISGFRGLFEPAVLPIMTGNSGKTHGNNTVRNPAIKELIMSVLVIIFYSPFYNSSFLCIQLKAKKLQNQESLNKSGHLQ